MRKSTRVLVETWLDVGILSLNVLHRGAPPSARPAEDITLMKMVMWEIDGFVGVYESFSILLDVCEMNALSESRRVDPGGLAARRCGYFAFGIGLIRLVYQPPQRSMSFVYKYRPFCFIFYTYIR